MIIKAICIKNIHEDGHIYHNLIIGEEYYIIDYSAYDVDICSIREGIVYNWYPKSWFMTQEEYRDKKLKELGI